MFVRVLNSGKALAIAGFSLKQQKQPCFVPHLLPYDLLSQYTTGRMNSPLCDNNFALLGFLVAPIAAFHATLDKTVSSHLLY